MQEVLAEPLARAMRARWQARPPRSGCRGRRVPVPARSSAVPWSTEVRTIGRPSVTLTPRAEARVLEHRQALVVVHGEHAVGALAGARGLNSVSAGSGPLGVDAGGARFGERRRDRRRSPRGRGGRIRRVRIEARDEDARARDAEALLQVGVEDAERLPSRPSRVIASGTSRKRKMRRRERDAQAAADQHHHDVRRAACARRGIRCGR